MRKKIVLFLLATALLMFASDLDYDITRVKTVSDDAYIPSLVFNLKRTIHFFNFNQRYGYVDMSKVLKWLETFESIEEAEEEAFLAHGVQTGYLDIEEVQGLEYVPTVIGYFEEALKMVEDVKIGPFDEEDEEEEALQERQEFISIWKEAVNSLVEFEYAVSLEKDVYLRRKYAADYERVDFSWIPFNIKDSKYDGLTIGTAVATGPEGSTTLEFDLSGVAEELVSSMKSTLAQAVNLKDFPSEKFVKVVTKSRHPLSDSHKLVVTRHVQQGAAVLLERLQWLGFKKLILTDGERTWSWDL